MHFHCTISVESTEHAMLILGRLERELDFPASQATIVESRLRRERRIVGPPNPLPLLVSLTALGLTAGAPFGAVVGLAAAVTGSFGPETDPVLAATAVGVVGGGLLGLACAAVASSTDRPNDSRCAVCTYTVARR